MLSFSGFNGFGQFAGGDRSARIFTEFPVDIPADNEHTSLLIACSWSYNAYAVGKTLMLRGFLGERPNSQVIRHTDECVRQLSACDRFCLVLLDDGRLFKIRPRLDGQLTEVRFAMVPSPERSAPLKRSIFGEPKAQRHPCLITHVACGSQIAVAVSRTNTVYNIPSRLHQFERHFRVLDLQCGFEHAVLLSGNGNVYCWGNGSRGQLGGGESLGIEEQPVLVEALAGLKITCVAAGGWHSAAISSFGDLYTWGYNVNGQLGLRVYKQGVQPELPRLKEPTVYVLPQIVDVECAKCVPLPDEDSSPNPSHPNECSVMQVYAGARHLIVRMRCGSLMAAGWNAYGQLSASDSMDFIDCFAPIKMNSIGEEEEISVICGEWCTVLRRRHGKTD